jgi:hypothetical protein
MPYWKLPLIIDVSHSGSVSWEDFGGRPSLISHKDIRHVLITRAVAEGQVPPLMWPQHEGAAAWNAFAEEERLFGEELP